MRDSISGARARQLAARPERPSRSGIANALAAKRVMAIDAAALATD
jgi:hypothetical protein